MTITHHPTDMILGAFAAGSLDEGRSVAIATHLSACPHCRRAVAQFESVGGVLLEGLSPATLRADASARALAAIDRDDSHVPASLTPRHGEDALPATLARYEIGPWRWIGPGVQRRSVAVPSDGGTRVFLLKSAPGTRMPAHSHSEIEWTCVLQGAFRHEYGRYGPGDFDEADGTVQHQPVVEDGVACICLVAMQGRLELQGLLGRLLQPFVRI